MVWTGCSYCNLHSFSGICILGEENYFHIKMFGVLIKKKSLNVEEEDVNCPQYGML